MRAVKANTAVTRLNRYIWEQRDKCDSVTEMNKQLILQYCRFVVLCEQISERLISEDLTPDDADALADNYIKFQRIVLNLYKTLKFEQIKDELTTYGNKFTALFKEAENDGL